MSSILKRVLPIAFAAVALTVLIHAPASAETSPVSQACGSVDLSTSNHADAAKSFDCFNDAFKRCTPAALVATGLDGSTPVIWTFSTTDGDHGCRVVEVVERGTGSAKTTDTYLCSAISRDPAQLSMSGCGSQRSVTLRIGEAATSRPAPAPN